MDSRQLLRSGRKKELWERFCGYFNLSPEDFMKIQERLLLEQIHRLGKSKSGRQLFGNKIPNSVEEFQQNVPLTTYTDYEDCFDKQIEDVLPEKPFV